MTTNTKVVRLDLGCGQNPRIDPVTNEKFTGVDIWEGADIPFDLFTFPWPWENDSVDEIFSSHFFEHVPQNLRFPFMDEVWRILKPCKCEKECPRLPNSSSFCLEQGGKASFITPYYSSMRSIQDPTHMWPPICENTYLYFNKIWREVNKLDHYKVSCDFDFGYGYIFDPETMTKYGATQSFWVKHYMNSVSDLQVTLAKRGRATK
jgi:hypothetical protein